MTQTYRIDGMTCGGCKQTVTKILSSIPGVKTVEVDLQNKSASLNITQSIPFQTLKNAIESGSRFQISEIEQPIIEQEEVPSKTWLSTYRPLFLVFGYILTLSLVPEINGFNWMRWMNHFMAGFFLTFSFFKLLDIRAFAESYAMYDIVARKWRGWGYVYAFIELGLGLAFLTGFQPLFTNAVTFVVMSISLVGVLQSVLNKRKIRCACLGAVFNLPMSTLTIVEDALMITMSLVMFLSMVG